MTTPGPLLSVIVPAHRAEHLLPDTLGALAASQLGRKHWELIVVDDGSPDDRTARAARHADRVLRLPAPPTGPGGARNAGAAEARGEWLMFVDADVRVHPDTLTRVAQAIQADPGLAAVFGAYDETPAASGVVSQYRNLLHRYVHLRGAGDAESFWAGCGAIRADLFRRLDGFDTIRFPRPQIEDIELGYRIRDAGGRIRLDPTIQGTHLKQWTLMSVIRTDIRDRGIPWTRLLLERRHRSCPTLNVQGAECAKVLLAALAFSLVILGGVLWAPEVVGLGGLGLLGLAVWNLPVHQWFSQVRGPGFAMATVPLLLTYYGCSAVAAAGGLLLHWLGPGGRGRSE